MFTHDVTTYQEFAIKSGIKRTSGKCGYLATAGGRILTIKVSIHDYDIHEQAQLHTKRLQAAFYHDIVQRMFIHGVTPDRGRGGFTTCCCISAAAC